MKAIYASFLLTPCLSLAQASDLQSQLEQGAFPQAIEQYAQTSDNQSKFVNAICQLGSSIENLQQQLYTYGFGVNSRTIGLRNQAPIAQNPNPEKIDYTKFRTIIEQFHKNLHAIEKTLTTLGDDDFYLPLDLTKVRFDVNQDGKRTELESSMALFLQINSRRPVSQQQAAEFDQFDGTIGFDRSDLIWLKGYVQVSLGLSDLVLAHDFEQAFNAISNNLFQKPKNTLNALGANDENYGDIANLIAALHLAKMPVNEPERLVQSRQHLLNMVTLSKAMWESVLAETDDRKEWLPSPKQNSVTGITITAEMVKDWHLFLTEYEAILNGEKLIPHWRFKEMGINLKRVFEESKETDVVLWITGHAAVPYLEKGERTKDDLWRQLNQTFEGNFLGLSFFIN
ncbi:hypothetical protein ACFPK9_01770 [Rubritalea spongiae]|uniref:Uncharacterized protein n=1 Tax=Rubritalea spongiae TaxID=430797 RepID=A0ABW5E2P7_9BACT